MAQVNSPHIGWSVFGVGGSGHDPAVSDPLCPGSPVKCVVAALLLHLVYGAVIGGLNPVWIQSETPSLQTEA